MAQANAIKEAIRNDLKQNGVNNAQGLDLGHYAANLNWSDLIQNSGVLDGVEEDAIMSILQNMFGNVSSDMIEDAASDLILDSVSSDDVAAAISRAVSTLG